MPQTVTEKEARSKWCRHGRMLAYSSRHTGVASAAVNRTLIDHKNDAPIAFCLASNCMAWEWHDPESVVEDERRGYCDAEEL